MRRFWPFLAALLCWLVVLAVPVTRQGVVTAWRQYRPPSEDKPSDVVAAGPFSTVSRRTASVLNRYPNDRAILIYAATHEFLTDREMKKLTALYPEDATILRIHLVRATSSLRGWRAPGPLTTRNFSGASQQVGPPSAALRAQWDDIITLARRGIQLEPNNTFFDWMLIYALCWTNRDEEARQVLGRAARKTVYDSHERDLTLSALTFLRRADGSPIPPYDLLLLRTSSQNLNAYYKFPLTSRMVMEKAIADREKGAREQSLQTALDLLKLSRVLRREGYSAGDSLTGADCERIALTGPYSQDAVVAAPVTMGSGATLAQPGNRPQSLSTYAVELKRTELATFLDAQWAAITKWNGTVGAYIRSGTADYAQKPLATIIFVERLRVLILRILPSILLVGILFWLLSRRFRDGLAAPVGWWKGAASGALLLAGALALDAATAFSERQYDYLELGYRYAFGKDLLEKSPSWFTWGLTGAMICFGLHWAVVWQHQRRGRKTFSGQLKALFEPSADGLAAFDFGWLFGWVARLTFWIILVAFLYGLSINITPDNSEIVFLAPIIIVGISLGAHLFAWRHGTHRRQTLKLSHRLIAESMGGFFVLVSVLYAVASFAILPTALQFERDFERALKDGELKIARGKLGLK